MERLVRMLRDLRARRRAMARHAEAGMTLIEIMVVVAIIGLVMGAVGVFAFGRYQAAQVKTTKQIILSVKQALEQYALDHSNEPCPKSLDDLYRQKILTKEPKDAWGRKLTFKCPGEQDTDSADITSFGRDGKEGTDDDIKSWELNK